MDTKKESLGALLGIFNRLSFQQRILIGGIVIVTVVLLGFVVFIFNEPSYSTLYTNLSPEDAANVVDQLGTQKVPYKIDDNGRTIKVPKDKVQEVRLVLAGKGIPNSGIIGYEIFDKNTMGMSEFMQKLNFKRALEGEIAKTIMQQKGVEGARVHIVFPEKSIFKNEQKDPTASVVLKLGTGVNLSHQNINAISYLVASSVEGLKPGKVNIIDTEGRLLSREDDESMFAGGSSKQYELKSSVENYLANKAQNIIDNVLGYGNSVIKVNVDLDFKQVEKSMELWDPESEVTISETTVKSQSAGTTITDSNSVANENVTTNYEFSKTYEKVIEGAGNIKRITVAAVINGIPTQTKNGDVTETVYQPRSDEELRKLERIISQSVGLDISRKDEISIVSIPFETKQIEDIPQEEISPINQIEKYSNYLLIFIAIGASLFVLKGLLKKLKSEKILIGTVGYNDQSFNDIPLNIPQSESIPQIQPTVKKKKRPLLEVGDIEDEITDEAQRKKLQHDKIVTYVAKNPSEAAKLINTWLREDEF